MQFFRRRRERGRPPHPDVLTPAEWRVLEQVRHGRTNAETAVRLGISVNTVRYHVSNMLAKTGTLDRAELAAWEGEPVDVPRSASRRFGLAAPWAWLRESGWFGKSVAVTAVVAVSVAGVVAIASLDALGDASGAPAAVATPPVTETPAVEEPATATPAPDPTPASREGPEGLLFCEESLGDLMVFERCNDLDAAGGFIVEQPGSAVEAATPPGTAIPYCIQPELPNGTYRIITNETCASQGDHGTDILLDGYRPVPPQSSAIPECSAALADEDIPTGCVWPPGSSRPQLLDAATAVGFVTGLRSCTSELEAYRELAALYEPAIEELTALAAGASVPPDLATAAEPIIGYEFDEHVPATGARDWHREVVADLEAAMADPSAEFTTPALETLTEAHAFYGLGRGCGG